jgi:carbon monoxide dehydrogenase subunit G
LLLNHHFTVDLGIEDAWAVFTDLERVATCFPGAELTEVHGDVYHGRMRVKVGPIGAQYAGTATFRERDPASKRAVIAATGRDSKGQGTAAATITAQLTDEGDRTAMAIETDLAITGKVAQFGRGALGEVSEQLLGVFLQRLEETLKTPDARGPSGPAEAARPPASTRPADDDVLNLNYVVVLPMLKKALPTVVAMALTAVLVRRMSCRAQDRAAG